MLKKIALVSVVAASALFAGDIRFGIGNQDAKEFGSRTDAYLKLRHHENGEGVAAQVKLQSLSVSSNYIYNIGGLVGYQFGDVDGVAVRLLPVGFGYSYNKNIFIPVPTNTALNETVRVNSLVYKAGFEASRKFDNATLNLGYYIDYYFRNRLSLNTPTGRQFARDLRETQVTKFRNAYVSTVSVGLDYDLGNNIFAGFETNYQFGNPDNLFGANFSIGYRY